MRNKIVIAVYGALAFGLIGCHFSQKNLPQTKQSNRAPNIPKQAIWIGGADGGNWYEIVRVLPASSFRIKIYDDSGEVAADTVFALNPACLDANIDSSGLLHGITGFDGQRILLTFQNNGRSCFLTPR